jgi:hypothetical protein
VVLSAHVGSGQGAPNASAGTLPQLVEARAQWLSHNQKAAANHGAPAENKGIPS